MYVRVIGHQWWWEFQYPELGISTANELHVPAGQTVRFDLQSADVIHSFWFPFMGGKVDVVPMRVNHMWYTPDASAASASPYLSQCVEFCGTEHAMMRNRLFVDTPEQFNAWAALQRQDAQVPQGDDVQRGAGLLLGGQCRNCHTIKGTTAIGVIGPNLTHVGSRSTIVSGTLDTNVDNLAKWIHDPQSVKPGAKMPTLGFSEADARSMAVYLMTLK
jgi:cytochrome c oxidase subunit 2